MLGINDKVVFLEKYGTGAPNSTGAYELDPSLAVCPSIVVALCVAHLSAQNDFNRAWRTMHVESDVFCAVGTFFVTPTV